MKRPQPSHAKRSHSAALARPGTVTLVGAGPGDPELLTLKAVKAIAAASLILVDDLVNEAVLAHAAPSARVVHVGKRGGCKSTPQAFIEKMMVSAALAGNTVVRLKGGDPFIFGRGGEEVAVLQAAGISVDVVNGITAGLAAMASLGVALTHREHAQGVVFLTGHNRADGEATNWPLIAQTAQQARLSVVVYMGVAGVERIQQGLLQGLAASTPCAIVENASMPQQRHHITTLAELSVAIAREGLRSPSVLVIGEVLRGLSALGLAQVPEQVMLGR